MSAGPSPAKDGSQVARKVKPPPGGIRFAKIHDGKQLTAPGKKIGDPGGTVLWPAMRIAPPGVSLGLIRTGAHFFGRHC